MSSSADLFLGIDLGTSSLKLLAIDAAGTVVAEARAAYRTLMPQPGWAEQQPEDWWQALCSACGELWAAGLRPASIAAIGFSGQMHGAVLLDRGGEPLRPCIIWSDQRTAPQIAVVEQALPRAKLLAITGNAPNTSMTALRLLWVRQHEPLLYARLATVLLPKDYLRWRLSDTLASDPTDASGTLLLDLQRRHWSDTVLRAFQIEPALLPALAECSEQTGTVSQAAARATGLLAGTPLVAGGGDTECAALGLGLGGAVGPDAPLLAALGTAGQLFAVTERPVIDPQGRLNSFCHVVPGRWHLMGAILAGGLSLQWLRNTLAGGGEQPTVAALLGEAASAAPGEVLFLPYLLGERTPHLDPLARGVFFGLRADHGRGDLTRAVLEGVAFALRDGLGLLGDLGITRSRVRLAGAAARSTLWRQIHADVFGLPCAVGVTDHGSAYGAALLAAVGVAALPSVEAAANLAATTSAVVLPDAERHTYYHACYERYVALYHALRPHFATWAGS